MRQKKLNMKHKMLIYFIILKHNFHLSITCYVKDKRYSCAFLFLFFNVNNHKNKLRIANFLIVTK